MIVHLCDRCGDQTDEQELHKIKTEWYGMPIATSPAHGEFYPMNGKEVCGKCRLRLHHRFSEAWHAKD